MKGDHQPGAPTMPEPEHEELRKLSKKELRTKLSTLEDPEKLLDAQMEWARRELGLKRLLARKTSAALSKKRAEPYQQYKFYTEELEKLSEIRDPKELLELQMRWAQRQLDLDRLATDAEARRINSQSRSVKAREFKSRHHASLQVRRTLIRRQQDYYRKYEEQLSRGRPGSSWRQCSDYRCRGTRCLYVDPVHMSYPKTTYGKNRLVARRVGLFLEAMVNHLFGDLEPTERKEKSRLIDSFLASPPLRGALGQFDTLCKSRRWNPRSRNLARSLTRIRNTVVYLVSTTRLDKPVPDVHLFYGGESATYPETWTLRHLAMQFCVMAEAWRRYGLNRGAEWGFGSDEAVADLLCAILLNFHSMRRREAVVVKRYNMLRLNESWENWLDRYHTLRQGDKGSEGGDSKAEASAGMDCLEGFGRGAIPWMSERMKEANGWYADGDEFDEDEPGLDAATLSWRKTRARISRKL